MRLTEWDEQRAVDEIFRQLKVEPTEDQRLYLSEALKAAWREGWKEGVYRLMLHID